MTQPLREDIIESAVRTADKFPKEQAVAYLRGMAQPFPDSPTSKKLKEIAEKYAKSA